MPIYLENDKGERIAVMQNIPVGTDPETGEEIFDAVIDEEATAALLNPAKQRENAYAAKTDAILTRITGYEREAQYWRRMGATGKALAADAKAEDALLEYGETRRAIRLRFPNTEPDKYLLTATGTYHAKHCPHAKTSAGEWLDLAEIKTTNPDAAPCHVCRAPELSESEKE